MPRRSRPEKHEEAPAVRAPAREPREAAPPLGSDGYTTERLPIGELLAMAAPYNPRTIDPPEFERLRASLRFFGVVEPAVANRRTGHLVGGHQRIKAAEAEGWADFPVHWVDLDPPSEKQLNLALNKISGRWDDEKLAALLRDLQTEGADLALTGFDDEELAKLLGEEGAGGGGDGTGRTAPSLSERFGVPPFSVLDARQGYWTERKKHWISVGIRSGEGRAGELTYALSSQPGSVYQAKNAYEAALGRKVGWEEFAAAHPEAIEQTGTSIFDPVLAELLVRWFSPGDGVVLDPFAGGSVRGVISAACGRRYVGIDLSEAQIAANRAQWPEVRSKLGPDVIAPDWRQGDSRGIAHLAKDVDADLILSCPPYADLERYSDHPDDLSTLSYSDFALAYRQIIAGAVARLRKDRFACFVVGEVRDRNGRYYGFVRETELAFEAAGAAFYGEAILVTQVGSLAIRSGRMFSATRKLGKTHQNVLVFCKGDPRAATEACGDLEIWLPEPDPAAALDAEDEASKPAPAGDSGGT